MADKLRILVVDDSKVVRKAFARILSSDYELVEAEDGEGAWESLQEDSEICAVFTDLNMPHLDGIGLIKRIRASDDPEIKELPVVLVTAAGEGDDTTKHALTVGANDYVLKPFDTVFLQSKAKAYVKPRDKELHDSKLASLDPLTRLANRTYFTERTEQEVSEANRHKTELAILLIAIDDFEPLSEKADSSVLKGIIRKLGGYMSSEVRLEDTVARIERDRFAIVLPETGLSPAVDMAERLRHKVQQKAIRHKNITFKVTVSIGVSSLPPKITRTFDMLMLEAERHLREAVANGGDRVIPAPSVDALKPPAVVSNSLDDALGMLNRRDEKMSPEQAQASLLQLMPLLEYCDELLGLELSEKLAAIKKRFSDTKLLITQARK